MQSAKNENSQCLYKEREINQAVQVMQLNAYLNMKNETYLIKSKNISLNSKHPYEKQAFGLLINRLLNGIYTLPVQWQ